MSVVVPSNPASLCAPKRKPGMAIKSEADVEEEAAGETCRGGVLKASRAHLPPCVKDPEDHPNSGDKEECATTQQRSKGDDLKLAQPDAGLQTGGNSLSGRSDSDDEEEVVSLVLSDDSGQCVTEDESHYITTHEIELSELSDHEGDYDLGVGSSTSWDIEDDRRVYSFVDYSFDADHGAAGLCSARAQGASAGVSTLRESDPFPSSDENTWKPPQRQQFRGDGGGQICLSIRATSRAINDPGNIQEQENILYRARRSGDVSRYVFRGVDGKAETLCDGAKCFIAAPGRMHFGGKLRGKKEVTDSSGTSSAVSELDDADKEVRNLTARAFKSLAYPYFDAINFSTSSESSASEHGRGLNRWSTFVDLKYGNVNVSQGLDQSVLSCQQSAASFEIANSIDNRGYKGLALAHIKPPTSKIFSISGSPRGASSSTQKIQLMGKFGQSSSGLIRLTETLNFRCNVKAGMSGGERRTKSAQTPAGSRSTDEVTNSLLRSQDRGASKPPLNAMEDMQKKSVFASSLLKNVLSKKIQFEQERKMERGEISEHHGGKQGSRDLRSQSSRLSESSSDCAPVCVEQLGDFVDSGSCDSRSTHSWRKDPAARAPETNLASQNEAGIDTKKGALGASRSTLLRSQNSAFRCWKDGELEFQKDHKNAKTLEDRLPSADEGEGDLSSARSKLTKMSHLFVPSIQLLSGEEEDEGGHANASASKSPEIKINLRSVRDDKSQAFGVSKRRAPILGSKAPSFSRADDFKCQALAAALKGESSDKVPHFTVRDIRENKGKLQTPIHQVRDVRKLVKSSYHFVSLDTSENKASSACADSHSEQRKQMQPRNPDPVSPIVIKCQSVNTNYPGKHPGNVEPENSGLRTETQMKPERGSELAEKKPESKVANQVALEKLQAAVKTMEQLYVFEKNEWKRKSKPEPLTDSHVLSLITSEELGGADGEDIGCSDVDKARRDSYPRTAASPAVQQPRQLTAFQVSSGHKPPSLHLSNNFTQTPFSDRNVAPKSPQLPVSVKVSSKKEAGEWKNEEKFHVSNALSDNYLTIPVKSHPKESKQPPPADKTSGYSFSNQSKPTPPPNHQWSGSRSQEQHMPKTTHSSHGMQTPSPEIPPATIYHSLPLGMSPSQPQMYCFSPIMTPAPTLEPFHATQRKMLLDPTTGNYYLVDTPVQPATKRLFDPETGRYVDMPIPHPGAYGQTYMIYPSFMPAPAVIPSRALVHSQMSVPSEAECGEKAPSQHNEGGYMESPFYMSTGTYHQAASGGQQQGAAAGRPQQTPSAVSQPIISITSQQGPRIIAPPSFDGTTMSFVVEHR
uniref:Chromosome 4 open reading frame 54 n=1 Tax=Oryzias latipes TaxID=8090 RepID=A0A3P9JBB5_ORYLA